MRESRLWGGRVSTGPAPALDRLNRSLPFDHRLGPFEIEIDRAWVDELARVGAIAESEARQLQLGLDAVERRLEAGEPACEPDEDIHSLIERWLEEEVGVSASQVRLGRSRNDVVATGGRMWARDYAMRSDLLVAELQDALLQVAENEGGIPFPLYSHMQPAQPTRAANWLLSHFWALDRGRSRLADAVARASELPLGAAAGAGTGIDVDRQRLAVRLGFDTAGPNSLDAVGSRDWAAELLWAWTMIAIDLSRLAEDLVLYSSAEFGLLRFADEWTTGSSLMPQKRNPDGAELARAAGGSMLGLLTGLLSTLKGLPSGYQKDLQEDKRALFAAYDRLAGVLEVLAGTVSSMRLHHDRALASIDASVLASDLAESLAEGGLPFREAHEVVGRLVAKAEDLGVALADLDDEQVRSIEPGLVGSWETRFDREAALQRRGAIGGSSREAVGRQLSEARKRLSERP
ncbi:MAG: argininosuccinate lyase [marine benthic group bacterium]|nr:argininosuccinate lyase [Gemmatimonadota bacterium]